LRSRGGSKGWGPPHPAGADPLWQRGVAHRLGGALEDELLVLLLRRLPLLSAALPPPTPTPIPLPRGGGGILTDPFGEDGPWGEGGGVLAPTATGIGRDPRQ